MGTAKVGARGHATNPEAFRISRRATTYISSAGRQRWAWADRQEPGAQREWRWAERTTGTLVMPVAKHAVATVSGLSGAALAKPVPVQVGAVYVSAEKIVSCGSVTLNDNAVPLVINVPVPDATPPTQEMELLVVTCA